MPATVRWCCTPDTWAPTPGPIGPSCPWTRRRGSKRDPASGEAIAWTSDQAAKYLLIGAFPVDERADAAISIDPALPGWMRNALRETTDAVFAFYERQLGHRLRGRTWILATYAGAADAGASHHGDALPGFVRLGLLRAAWATPAEVDAQLRLFVAHEVFHLCSDSATATVKRLPVWLLEGGAEAAALDFAERTGRIEAAAALARKNRAFAQCAEQDGATLGRKLAAAKGNAPYVWRRGGLPSRRAIAGGRGPPRRDRCRSGRDCSRTRPIRRRARPAARRGGCLPGRGGRHRPATSRRSRGRRVARRRVRRRDVAFDRLAAPLRLHRVAPQALSPRASVALAARAVFQLMKQDCREGYGFWREEDALRVDPNPTCRTFDRPLRLTGLLGHDFRTHGAEAYRAATERCAARGTIAFEHDGDGRSRWSCTAPLQRLSTVFAFDDPAPATRPASIDEPPYLNPETSCGTYGASSVAISSPVNVSDNAAIASSDAASSSRRRSARSPPATA